MLLNDVKKVLETLDPLVFYGLTPPSLRDKNGDEIDEWNYSVFNRTKLKNSANKTSYSDAFDVHIVREEFIPEGTDTEYIEKLTAIPGVRLAGDDGVFDYMMKPGTDHVVEMLTLSFVRARK